MFYFILVVLPLIWWIKIYKSVWQSQTSFLTRAAYGPITTQLNIRTGARCWSCCCCWPLPWQRLMSTQAANKTVESRSGQHHWCERGDGELLEPASDNDRDQIQNLTQLNVKWNIWRMRQGMNTTLLLSRPGEVLFSVASVCCLFVCLFVCLLTVTASAMCKVS